MTVRLCKVIRGRRCVVNEEPNETKVVKFYGGYF